MIIKESNSFDKSRIASYKILSVEAERLLCKVPPGGDTWHLCFISGAVLGAILSELTTPETLGSAPAFL